ncbi:MAG: glycogen-binding domain-containing protein [Candidatus Omnitrophica bacterium]|nr:glycogen-binding domain-containing protein [Candidatus Omnitrophota bacterium]
MNRILKSTTAAKAKETTFKLYAPSAKKVSVAGTFNNWDIKKLTAKKDVRGNWNVAISLKPGRYEYKFVVDGSWITDPVNTNTVGNNLGTVNSFIDVK